MGESPWLPSVCEEERESLCVFLIAKLCKTKTLEVMCVYMRVKGSGPKPPLGFPHGLESNHMDRVGSYKCFTNRSSNNICNHIKSRNMQHSI